MASLRCGSVLPVPRVFDPAIVVFAAAVVVPAIGEDIGAPGLVGGFGVMSAMSTS